MCHELLQNLRYTVLSSFRLYVASQSEGFLLECSLCKATVSSTIRFIYFCCPWHPLSGCCLGGASLTTLGVHVILNLIIIQFPYSIYEYSWSVFLTGTFSHNYNINNRIMKILMSFESTAVHTVYSMTVNAGGDTAFSNNPLQTNY